MNTISIFAVIGVFALTKFFVYDILEPLNRPRRR